MSKSIHTSATQGTLPVSLTPLNQWQSLFPAMILRRGRMYYGAGSVKTLVRKDRCHSAVVSGSKDYDVVISYDGNQIAAMTCSCACAQQGERCKHMAAVLFAVAGNLPDEANAHVDADAQEIRRDEMKQASIPQSFKQPVAEETDFSIEDLDRMIEQWKRDLLDTGKRNKMINYRETRRSTLRILEPGAEELFNQLAITEKTLTFQKPISKESDIRTYSLLSLFETLSYSLPVTRGDIKTEGTIVEREKTLKNLRSKAKLAQEEQGTNILYLCFGFIYWRENNRESSPWIKSPLLMMPVTLGLKSLNAPYTLAKGDDEIEVNPTLDYLFNAEYNIDLPTFELKNKSSFAEYMATIEEIVDRRGWKVVPEVSLGLLSFLKISMYHDLNDHRELMIHNPVLRAMAGDKGAFGEIPAAAKEYDFDKSYPEQWHEVVNADSSQEDAILFSKAGVSFVMQGPPGTGKSQTITNIIAEALADGKKVLFVSEKAAALQVVLKRMSEVGLADFCLSLHDYKANKKEIINNIGANLNIRREYLNDSVYKELVELFQDRQYLDTYAEQLHRPILPLGDSVYVVFGKLSGLEAASTVGFSMDHPMEVTKDQYASLLYCVSAFERALQSMEGALTDNPWYGTNAISSEQSYKQELAAATGGLPDALREMNRIAGAMNDAYQTAFDLTWNGVSAGTNELGRALELPLLDPDWIDASRRSSMLSVIQYEEQMQARYYAQCEAYRGVFSDRVLDAPVDAWVETIERETGVLEDLGFKNKTAAGFYSSAIANSGKAQKLIEELKAFVKRYRLVNASIGIGETDSFANARLADDILCLSAGKPRYMDAAWFQTDVFEKASRQLSVASVHAASLHKAKRQIADGWKDEVDQINPDQIRDCLDQNRFCAKLDMGQQLDEEMAAATALLKEIQGLSEAQAAACELLHHSGLDSFENMAMLSRVLGMIAAAPYMAADWFHERKNAECALMIEEAIKTANSIREQTDALLINWEPSALEMDAEGMLARFKTEYTGLFHKMKANYKEDMKTIRLNARAVGKPVDESHAVELLQKIKAIHTEEKWFDHHAAQLSDILGARYKGLKTDWITVRKSMQTALEIAGAFPYGNIPEETIGAILLITDSIPCTAEARRLAEALSTERLDVCARAIESSGYAKGFTRSASVRDQVIPAIQSAIDAGEKLHTPIDQLKKAKRNPELLYADVDALLENMDVQSREHAWFDANAGINQRLFAEAYEGADTDWASVQAALALVASVADRFEGKTIPEQTIRYICSEENPAGSVQNDDLLSPGRIAMLRRAIREINPQLDKDDCSVSDVLVVALEAYVHSAETITSVIHAMDDYVAQDEPDADILFKTLNSVRLAKSIRCEFLQREEKNRSLFGDQYTGIDTQWASLCQKITAVDSFISESRSVVTDQTMRLLCNSVEQRKAVAGQHARLAELVEKTGPGLAYFQRQFSDTDFAHQQLQSVAQRYERCLNGFGELNKWLDYTETRSECDKLGLSDFTARIAQADNSIPDVVAAFEKGFYLQWIKLAVDTVPAVQLFRRRVHEQRIDRFIKNDQIQFDLSRRRIREKIISTFPRGNQMAKAGSELGILRHEMEKKRRIMPLRKLFRSIPNLLLTLKPCLMMSPLSVAYFLEAGHYQFDMVIFDEASQIFPQDAIGAIFRAKQVIIVGDTKQLPPTSFFASSTGNNDEAFEDENSYEDEVYNSILEETANVLPNKKLLWHYRSQHEHLIAFSNQEIYKNELVTFPSSCESEKDTGVEFIHVEDGYYVGGGRNCNMPEAKRCVELVREHFDRHPDRSLGIIAFSEKQQNAIALEIQKFREGNPQYEAFFAEGKEDEFFIKNLENVQGDERDTIIFSIGYAKTKEQKEKNKPMAMRFGPLGVQGGERRLNVAITRARKNIKLVSSILPSDIDLNKTASEGIRMLRAYIEFAMNGEAALASAQSNVRHDGFVDAVAAFLQNRGYKVSQYIGCSEYRIDIAVRYPSDVAEQFAAGIECDGYSYASARTARDRDRLRGAVLKNMGWNMYRIWSSEWYKNPEIEGERLIQFVDAAIAECGKKVKAIEEEKLKAEEARRKAEEAQRLEQERKRETERKRIEEAERKEAQARAAREARRRLEAQHPADTEQARRENGRRYLEAGEEQRRSVSSKVDVSWVKKDALVRHKSFGIGRVMEIKAGYITIQFGIGEKNFTFPTSFETGFLSRPTEADDANAAPGKHKPVKSPAEVIRSLTEKGFTCIDNRVTSGILWVLYSAEKKAVFEEMMKDCNAQVKFEKRGAIATQNAPTWRVMFMKQEAML